MKQLFIILALIVPTLISCAKPEAPTEVVPIISPTATLMVEESVTMVLATPHPLVSLTKVQEIYLAGRLLENNPNSFSKIGDCETGTDWFLTPFDGNSTDYSLGEYSYLEPVIDYFQGSFGRTSLAAGKGYSTSSVLASIWADPKLCQTGETPLTCEVRIHKPSFAFVMLGTNDVFSISKFEKNMRVILDYLISQGVVPILVTKADNVEGDHSINLTILNLASEYDLPLLDYWTVVQPLPSHGLQEDGIHLTWAPNNFDNPANMLSAWPWRNLTALETLNRVWSSVDLK